MLLSLNIDTLVASAIGPGLKTVTMLLILLPLTSVLCTIEVTVDALTMGFIVLPVSIINITICMNETTLSIGLVVCPISFVQRTIRPDLNSLALTNCRVIEPLALVLRSVFEQNHLATLSASKSSFKFIVVVVEVSKLLTHLLHVDVVVVVLTEVSSAPRRVHLVAQLLNMSLRKPHAECAL